MTETATNGRVPGIGGAEEPRPQGAILWRCLACGYVNIDVAACEFCGVVAHPAAAARVASQAAVESPVAVEPAVAESPVESPVAVESAAAVGLPAAMDTPVRPRRRRLLAVGALGLVLVLLAGTVLVARRRQPPAFTLTAAQVQLRLPPGWQPTTPAAGVDFAADGPGGARLEIRHSAGPTDLLGLYEGLRSGQLVLDGVTVDQPSVRFDDVPAGQGVRARATFDGQPLDAVVLVVAARTVSLALFRAGGEPAVSGFDRILTSLRPHLTPAA